MLQVLSANRLRDGIIVYLSPSGDWRPQIGEAALFSSKEASEAALAKAHAAVAANLVIDPLIVDVTESPKGRTALSLRNSIRALGPTVKFRGSSTAA
ncbi:MAG TPA: DUF2849 domain-containing protein [Methylovirgula sp.]|jgi:hypothetical protein